MRKKQKIRQIVRHLDDFFKNNRISVIILLLALLFDTVSTIYFMGIDGIHCEIHPMVRFSALFFGPILGTFLAAFLYKAIVSVMLAAYLQRFRTFILLMPTITSTIAGFMNFYGFSLG